ncbi:uncharacterized protein LOC132723774 [Ruditapes philippinarum]|uniref:uncharacterized protein LOC132723774 n=1 Tax=Ruditapes philippinarum TaxID=129788 RepID=UPI00295A87F4|nr:uncharacterized protein LOC132723774 [Ruditapes philippinarum]
MAKSRSEIQKAYRERQKAKGAAFLEKERARQRQYYVPAAELTSKKRALRNSKNKLRNRLCRIRKRQLQEENNNSNVDTSGYESINTECDSEQNNDQGPSVASRPKLIIKMPNIGAGVRKVNARALSRANRTISTLKAEVDKLKRKIKTKNKKIERISKKAKLTQSDSGNLTPNKKTLADLEVLKLTPKRRQIAKRKLLTCNVLMHEIYEAKKASGQKKVNSIHRIISGKVAKKYRCLKSISHGTKVSRRSLARTFDKNIINRKERRQSLSKVVEKSVVEFLSREDNCRTQPGKSDAKKVENHKDKQQTKVLTDYLKNLHDKYKAENPMNKISLSTFARLRPTNILLASFISRNTCQCIHHQNMALKVQSLRKAGVRISDNPENLIVHKDDMEQLLNNLPEKITYRVWQKVDIGNGKTKMKIVDKEEELPKFRHDLIKQVNMFEQHVQRVREQYQQVRLLKESLPEDEIMVQMDFAENYSCRSLNEIQTAYWNQTMVTIHPAVAYFRENGELKHKSYVLISDEMAHCSSTVCTFLDHIIPELKILNPRLSFIHYWTDSPSSQYRNRYIFHTLARHKTIYNMGARWNYFEVGHGKGPCDGLGGTTKRMADMAIRQGHVQIQNAEDFYTWGSNSGMSAKFLYVSTEETKRKHDEMSLIKIKPLKGTMKLHAVGAPDTDGILMTRETSCYCHICLSGSYCNSWNKEKFIYESDNETRGPKTNTVPDEKEHEESVKSNEMVSDVDTEPSGPDLDNTSANKDLEIGTMVAAVYEKAWYIGKVEDKDEEEGDYQINFMEKAKKMFKWPQVEDCIWRDSCDILCVVETLQPSGKSMRLFKIDAEEKAKIEKLFSYKKM